MIQRGSDTSFTNLWSLLLYIQLLLQQRGSDTSFTNLWSLLLYIQLLLHYVENAQENNFNI